MAFSIALDTVKQVVPRVSGVGSVTISGTQTDETTAIQYRIVDFITGTTGITGHSAWTNLVLTPSANWSETITAIPSADHEDLDAVGTDGWYKIEVRLADDTGTTDASGKFGVGAFVPVLGQSNAALVFARQPDEAGEPTLSIPSLSAAYTTSFSDLTTDMDGLIEYAERFIDAEHVPVCFLPFAVGGTALDANIYPDASGWLDLTAGQGPGDSTPLYTLFATAMAAVGGVAEFVIWYQGEFDSQFYTPSSSYTFEGYTVDPPTTEDNYFANLNILLGWLKTDCDSGVGFGICTLCRREDDRDNTDYPKLNNWQSVRNAQSRVVNDESNAYRLDTVQYTLRLDNGTEYVHLDLTSRQDIGDKLGYLHLHHLDSATYPYAPPTILGFKPLTATTTEIFVSSSTLTPSSGLQGWEMFDEDFNAVAVSSATYASSSITLTHTTMTGPRIPRYMDGNDVPFQDGSTPVVSQESVGIDWPLGWDINIGQEIIIKVADKYASRGDEHGHWNFKVLDEISASYSETEKTKLSDVWADYTGTEFPTLNLQEGVTFFHSTLLTLFFYVDALWFPIESFGALTTYIDLTDGTDAIGKGYAVDSGACKTFAYWRDNILPNTLRGNVTLTCSEEDFEAVESDLRMSGIDLLGDYTVEIIGATPSSPTKSGVLTDNLLTDTTVFFAHHIEDTGNFSATAKLYTGQIIEFLDGDAVGVKAVVENNDLDNLYIVGEPWGASPPQSGDSYRMYIPGTVIPKITLNNQTGIVLSDVAAGQGNEFIDCLNGSSATLNSCYADDLTAVGFQIVRAKSGSEITVNESYIRGNLSISCNRGEITIDGSMTKMRSNLAYNVLAQSNGKIAILNGSVIDANAKNLTIGAIYSTQSSVIQFDDDATVGQQVKVINATGGVAIGTFEDQLGTFIDRAAVKYINNTNDHDGSHTLDGDVEVSGVLSSSSTSTINTSGNSATADRATLHTATAWSSNSRAVAVNGETDKFGSSSNNTPTINCSTGDMNIRTLVYSNILIGGITKAALDILTTVLGQTASFSMATGGNHDTSSYSAFAEEIVPLDTTEESDANYTLSSNVVVPSSAGRYRISGGVALGDISSGTADVFHARFFFQLHIDGVSQPKVERPGSLLGSTGIGGAQRGEPANFSEIFTLTAGQDIELIVLVSASADFRIYANGTYLNLERLE